MSQQSIDPSAYKAQVQTQTRQGLDRMWWILLIEGIATLVLGGLLLMNPAASAVGLTLFLGIWLLIQGIMAFVGLFVENHRAWYWDILWGILGVVAGLIVLANPIISTFVAGTTLVFMIAFMAIFMGIIGIIRAFTGGNGFGWGNLILGIITLVLGGYLLFNPLAAVVSLPWVLGFLALFGGISMLFQAFRARSMRNTIPA